MPRHDKWGQGEERTASAHHEAGHAVIDKHIGLPFETADIRRENGDLGGCQGVAPSKEILNEVEGLLQNRLEGRSVTVSGVTPASREWIDKMILSSFAGQLAEEKFRGRPLSPDEALGIIEDHETVRKLAEIRWADAERQQRVNEMKCKVGELLEEPAIWKAVVEVAQTLLERELLSQVDVGEVYQAAMSKEHDE